jgi:UDP-N-acetylmuramoyl-tripeptide--D-alanyl-D-alanine ligase
MRELGSASVVEHDGVGRLAVRLGVSKLVVVGEAAAAMHTGACHGGLVGRRVGAGADVDAAHDLLTQQLRPGDVVLLKSSRDAGLRWLGDRLAGIPR